jgi:hypothetical protein
MKELEKHCAVEDLWSCLEQNPEEPHNCLMLAAPSPDSGPVATKKAKRRKNTLLVFASNRIRLRNDGGGMKSILVFFSFVAAKNRWWGHSGESQHNVMWKCRNSLDVHIMFVVH